MDDNESETDKECPICGRPYDHKRKERPMKAPTLRRDATACKTDELGGERTVYVHLNAGQVVSRVVREPDEDESTGLGRLFG